MEENKNAGFWIRFLAIFIDILIMALPLAFIMAMITGITENPITDLIIIVITITLWVKWQGKTPGKHLLGIRIVNLDGSDISLKTAIIRYFSTILSGLLLGIGFLMVAFREDKRSLHDLIAGTKVVYFDTN